jgi:cysteinyl-tRNA synthetase
MEWETPWGVGFPGWHLECSAMSMKYLGETLDIHAGGIDHIPVHHTNEIAQSEAATGKQFARYWVHGDFLLIDENRMGKSEGNFITINTLEEKGFEPIVYRFFCLSAHYRSKLNFTWGALENAKSSWNKLKTKFLNLGRQNGHINQELLKEFRDAVNNDLSMPEAVAIMWKTFSSDISDADKRTTILEFDKVFGLRLDALEEEQIEIPKQVQELVEKRRQARQKGKWEKADGFRREIEALGWQVEDTADGERIKKGRSL